MPCKQLPTVHRDVRLDSIRGIAVLLVVFSHLLIPDISPRNFADQLFNVFTDVFKFIRTGGWIGVDLFFVLSGFLVSGLLFREFELTGKISLVSFLIRRGLKIYPVFYSFLLLTFLVDYLLYKFGLPALYNFAGMENQVSLYLHDMLFLSNYIPGRWLHSWSLDVEELFYILLMLYAALLIKLKKLNHVSLFYTWLLLWLIGMLFRAMAYQQHPTFNFSLQYSKSHFRLDALFFGVLLSWFYSRQSERVAVFRKFQFLRVTAAIAWLLTNFLFARAGNPWISVISLGLNPICFGVLLIQALNSNYSFLQNRGLAYIGRISFAVYLFHPFVSMCFITWLPAIKTSKPCWFIYFASYPCVSFALGSLFTRLIEVPFLNYRNKYFPSKITALPL